MNIEALECMLANGKDGALLRFGLGKGWLDAGNPVRAATHLGRCVVLDPQYSAAWKLLGKAWLASGQPQAANVTATRTLLLGWFGDMVDGNHTAAFYPGGTVFSALVGNGTITALP